MGNQLKGFGISSALAVAETKPIEDRGFYLSSIYFASRSHPTPDKEIQKLMISGFGDQIYLSCKASKEADHDQAEPE